MGFLNPLFGRGKPPPDPFGRVDVEEFRVVYHGPERAEEIAWRDLIEVGIVTTDEGPFQEDVYFLLLGPTKDKGCSVPQGATGSQALVKRLQTLPGFDNESLIRAMGCTSNSRFTCWVKKAEPNHVPDPTLPSVTPAAGQPSRRS